MLLISDFTNCLLTFKIIIFLVVIFWRCKVTAILVPQQTVPIFSSFAVWTTIEFMAKSHILPVFLSKTPTKLGKNHKNPLPFSRYSQGFCIFFIILTQWKRASLLWGKSLFCLRERDLFSAFGIKCLCKSSVEATIFGNLRCQTTWSCRKTGFHHDELR